MDDLLNEIARVEAIQNEIKCTWFEVFLKSGQSLWIQAHDIEIASEIVQEKVEEDGELVLPEIKYVQLQFFDEAGDRVQGYFIPYENVEAIRIWDPISYEESDEDE